MSQEEFKRRLKVLMNKPENQICSDCPERQPRWASLIVPPPGSPDGALPIGAFCCLECSGSHRRLGVHISFVRSINLDSWKEKEVLAMENGGNAKVNTIFEARLGNFGAHSGKPEAGADGRTRERFIRDKYERRKYFDASVLQRIYDEGNDESDEEEESEESEEEQKVSPKNKTGMVPIAPIRAPSEAAVKRVENRRSRLAAARRAANDAASKKEGKKAGKKKVPPRAPAPEPAPAPAPAPQQPEVDLLDFGTPMKDPGPPPSPPSAAPSPTLDLFGSMTIEDNTAASAAVDNTSFFLDSNQTAPSPAPELKPQEPEKKKFNSEQILSMFNAPQQNQIPYNMGVMNNNSMHMVNGMGVGPMNQNGMPIMQSNTMPNMMMQQPQPANMMMQQPQPANMMMIHQGNMNMMMMQQNNPKMVMMMQQQQQQQQQNQNQSWNNNQMQNTGMNNAMNMNQPHIAMMNQLQMGNSAMMMMSAAPGSSGSKQNRQNVNMLQPQQQNQTAGMNSFGL